MQCCGVLLAQQQLGCLADMQLSTDTACMAWQSLERQLTQHMSTRGPRAAPRTQTAVERTSGRIQSAYTSSPSKLLTKKVLCVAPFMLMHRRMQASSAPSRLSSVTAKVGRHSISSSSPSLHNGRGQCWCCHRCAGLHVPSDRDSSFPPCTAPDSNRQ